MKIPQAIFHMTLLVALVAMQTVAAQEQQRHTYAVIDYMKVETGKSDEYKSVETDIWKKIHQRRIADGAILYWGLYELKNDEDNGRRYNFMTVNVYDSFAKIEEPNFLETIAKVYSNDDMSAHMARTEAARDLIWSELWHIDNAVLGKPNTGPVLVLADYQQPAQGKVSDYTEAENEVWRQIHKARIDAGKMTQWAFLSRQFPGGSGMPYSFLTLNTYADTAMLEQSAVGETIEALWEKLSERQQELLETTSELRETVKHDLWQRVDFAAGPTSD